MEVAMVDAVLESRYSEADEYGNTDEIWSEKLRCSPNTKPRFRTE